MYGTSERLATLAEGAPFVKIDIANAPSAIREALADFGYYISFNKKADVKPPAIAVLRHDNALFFSVYNPDTTTDAVMRFPFGAPILCGMETEMKDGHACICFARGEHRECRVFASQADGVISCREAPPVNARYRRAIRISGLRDATLCLFPEKGCECAVSTAGSTDSTPEYDPRFERVTDEVYGTYLRGEHINGQIYFLIGRKA